MKTANSQASPAEERKRQSNYSTIFPVFLLFFLLCFYCRGNFWDFQISFVLASFASYTSRVSRTLAKQSRHKKMELANWVWKLTKTHRTWSIFSTPNDDGWADNRMGKKIIFIMLYFSIIMLLLVLSTLLFLHGVEIYDRRWWESPQHFIPFYDFIWESTRHFGWESWNKEGKGVDWRETRKGVNLLRCYLLEHLVEARVRECVSVCFAKAGSRWTGFIDEPHQVEFRVILPKSIILN